MMLLPTGLLPRSVLALLLLATVWTGDVHAAAAGGEEGGILSMVAKLANFAILAGVLLYFLRSPIGAYLDSRSTQIRQDLVRAAEMKAAAAAQLDEIAQKLRALPAELDGLKARGAEDVQAERARIAGAAAAERDRLLEQTRRELETRLRVAKRELTAHAAELAVTVARRRIEQSITPEDQMRLVDRYASQLTGAPR